MWRSSISLLALLSLALEVQSRALEIRQNDAAPTPSIRIAPQWSLAASVPTVTLVMPPTSTSLSPATNTEESIPFVTQTDSSKASSDTELPSSPHSPNALPASALTAIILGGIFLVVMSGFIAWLAQRRGRPGTDSTSSSSKRRASWWQRKKKQLPAPPPDGEKLRFNPPHMPKLKHMSRFRMDHHRDFKPQPPLPVAIAATAGSSGRDRDIVMAETTHKKSYPIRSSSRAGARVLAAKAAAEQPQMKQRDDAVRSAAQTPEVPSRPGTASTKSERGDLTASLGNAKRGSWFGGRREAGHVKIPDEEIPITGQAL